MTTPAITPEELAAKLQNGQSIVLLDVREPHELEISKLEGVIIMPMATVTTRYEELDPHAETVVICRSGRRSERVTEYLIEKGFTNVRNLTGGMNAWAATIDPRLPQY